jgi:prefoldin subunit 5
MLRQQIVDITESHKKAELRSSLAIDRLKTRVDQLSKRNEELLEEVRVLEEERAMLLLEAQPKPKSVSHTTSITDDSSFS